MLMNQNVFIFILTPVTNNTTQQIHVRSVFFQVT